MHIYPYLLQALSPLHAGTGQSAGIIDLPIARMRATGIPFVPGSSIKGVLRDARRRDNLATDTLYAVFGPDRAQSGSADDGPGRNSDTPESIDHAGALIVGDARLLALPVRSFRGAFALVSSPLLLHLARRDLVEAGLEPPSRLNAFAPGRPAARVIIGNAVNVYSPADPDRADARVYLDDLDLPVEHHPSVNKWADFIADALPEDERSIIAQRLVIVDDDTMSYLWQTATQVDTRVRIGDSGVVEDGALWTEESLPPESLLIGLMAAHASLRKDAPLTAAEILDAAVPQATRVLQFGGKSTVGRGRCGFHQFCAPAPAGEKS